MLNTVTLCEFVGTLFIYVCHSIRLLFFTVFAFLPYCTNWIFVYAFFPFCSTESKMFEEFRPSVSKYVCAELWPFLVIRYLITDSWWRWWTMLLYSIKGLIQLPIVSCFIKLSVQTDFQVITYLYYAKIRMLIWLKIKYENPDNTSYEFQPSCDVRDLHPCNTIWRPPVWQSLIFFSKFNFGRIFVYCQI